MGSKHRRRKGMAGGTKLDSHGSSTGYTGVQTRSPVLSLEKSSDNSASRHPKTSTNSGLGSSSNSNSNRNNSSSRIKQGKISRKLASWSLPHLHLPPTSLKHSLSTASQLHNSTTTSSRTSSTSSFPTTFVSVSHKPPNTARIITHLKQRRQEKKHIIDDIKTDYDNASRVGFCPGGHSRSSSVHRKAMEAEASSGENSPMEYVEGLSTIYSQISKDIEESTSSNSHMRYSYKVPRSTSRSVQIQGQKEKSVIIRAPERVTVLSDALSKEIDDFLAGAEQQELRNFTKRYNYDIVKDRPLPGRFEWMQMHP